MNKLDQVKLRRTVDRQLEKEATGFQRSGFGFYGGDRRMVSRKSRQLRKLELRGGQHD
jgi:hypothetical protein